MPALAPAAIIPPKVQVPATDEDKVRAFLIGHHEKLTNRDLDGVMSTYGVVAQINGRDMTHDQIRERQAEIFSSRATITEKVNGPIEVNRGRNNRFSASYTIVFEVAIPDADDERGEASVDVAVLITGNGLRIVSRQLNVYRNEKIKNR